MRASLLLKDFLPGLKPAIFRASIPRIFAFPKRQEGVVLVLTLIVLVAMTLATIALVRSIDTGNVVAGNMAFRQGATQAADAGTEAAITFLLTGGVGGIPIAGDSASYVDIPSQGYFATAPSPDLDMTGNSHDGTRGLVNWNGNNCQGATPTPTACVTPAPSLTVDSAGNTVTYVIHRLCSQAGAVNAANNNCVTFLAQGAQSPVRGELKIGKDRRFALDPIEYYRITSRVSGPRNTSSYVETVIHF